MAYFYTDEDGEECVHFEKGKWDSLFGYQCPNCHTYIGTPRAAAEHENELPCLKEPEVWRWVFWTGSNRGATP